MPFLFKDLFFKKMLTHLLILYPGPVSGVRVSSVSATSVSVSWLKLNSQDISGYRVFYSRTDKDNRKRQEGQGTLRVSAETNLVVVTGLVEGEEYQFQVVGLVIVNGLEREGVDRSEGSMAIVGGVRGESSRDGYVLV